MFKKHMTARCLEFLNNKSQICVRNKQIFTHLLRLKNTQTWKWLIHWYTNSCSYFCTAWKQTKKQGESSKWSSSLFIPTTVSLWGTRVRKDIELLLGTVDNVIVSAPMELYQVAEEIWRKCHKVSVMISEMPWHEIKAQRAHTGQTTET